MVLVPHLPCTTQPTDSLCMQGMLVYLPTSTASGRHPSLEPAITLITHADFLEVTYMYILYINYDYIIYYILYYHNIA